MCSMDLAVKNLKLKLILLSLYISVYVYIYIYIYIYIFSSLKIHNLLYARQVLHARETTETKRNNPCIQAISTVDKKANKSDNYNLESVMMTETKRGRK